MSVGGRLEGGGGLVHRSEMGLLLNFISIFALGLGRVYPSRAAPGLVCV